MTEREAAEELEITTTAAQHAAAVGRQMASLGLTDPYLPLREPPTFKTKLRRHLHVRYSFEPLPGFPLESW